MQPAGGLVEEPGPIAERLLDSVGQLGPLLAQPRRQVAEGADGLLPGALGGADGFDRHIVAVGLSQVYDHYIQGIIPATKNET